MLIDTIITVPIKQDANGLLFQYDAGRSKWVSAARNIATFSRNHRNLSNDQWLRYADIASVQQGYMVRRNAVITSVACRCTIAADCSFVIRRNDNPADLTSIGLSSEVSKVVDGLDIEVNAGDWLQVLLQVSSGNVDYPIVTIETAWRE